MDVYLDNILVDNPTDTMKNPTFTERREDQAGEQAISFTGELIFTGDEYAYIYQKLVTDANALDNTVEIKWVDRCCGQNKEFPFIIKSESLTWCEGECKIKASAVEFSENSKKYDCIKNTVVFDNWNGFQTQTHPKISYCIEFRPSILQDSIIILAIIVNFILIILYPIVLIVQIVVSVINAIIAVVNALGGSIDEIDFDGNASTNVLQEYENFRDRLNEFMIGCGRKHPSPLVRKYAENVCGKCGLAYQSSIFNNVNSQYYNTVYFNAPVTKGNLSSDPSNFIDKNKPLLTGMKYFNQLNEAVNGKWRIIGNNLIHERRDYFQTGNIWLDLLTYDPEKIISICYTWTGRPRYALGHFEYSKDATDWIGNEAVDRWSDIVEWNFPPSSTQKDEYLRYLPYSAARFRDDGIERDVLSDYQGAPFVGPIIQQYDNVMIMNNGTAFNPKLLIWDGNDTENGKIQTNYGTAAQGLPNDEKYNLPFWIDANIAQGNSLYDFWRIENPREQAFSFFKVSVELVYDCDTYNNRDIDGIFVTPRGQAQTTLIEINEKSGTMKITGEL